MFDDALHVAFKLIVSGRVFEQIDMRRLKPAGIMNVGLWLALLSDLRMRVPAAIEQDKHYLDIMAVCNFE